MVRRMFATRALYALSFISAAPTAFATFVLGLLREIRIFISQVCSCTDFTLCLGLVSTFTQASAPAPPLTWKKCIILDLSS